MQTKIIISGMGCISAAGQDVPEHLYALQNGSRNCQQVPKWLFLTKHKYPVCLCPQNALNDKGRDFLSMLGTSNSKENLSRTAQLLVSAVAEAVNCAGIAATDLKGKRLGIAIGTTVGCTFNDENYYKSYRNGERSTFKPVIDYLNNNLAQRLHALLGTNGPSLVVTNACASGTDAIGLAGTWLAADLCDIVIAGGADELSRIAYNGFVSLLLTDVSPCRPFDKTRKGLNLGEGAGVVVLEREDDAIAKGGICGWLRGYGASSDAWHPTAPNPEGVGIVRAVQQATHFTDATVKFDLINTHGTGTMANDIAESNALSTIIGHEKNVAVVSTKGWTGHTLGAAGGIEAVLTLLSLNNQTAWGTLGCDSPDPDFQVEIALQNSQQRLTGRLGLSQSLAFGGCNSALILEGCQ